MNWFDGSTTDAIKSAKDNKSIFIVFVNGDDSVSRELLKSWQDDRIGKLSTADKCVGLKLDANSEAAVQFSQIYPVMIFPTVYFIGNNGQPLEVCVGEINTDQLLDRFNNALHLHQSTLSAVQSDQLSSPPDSGSDTQKDRASSSAEYQAEAVSFNDGGMEVDDDETIEAKAEKAKQLIAERQREKLRQKEEEEKQKEFERRKVGQEALKFKQWKDEMAKKEAENMYKKEKEEARLAREKVRSDLERDRQERQKKYYDEKAEKEEAVEKVKRAKLEVENERLAKETAIKRETARIQFRLPNGSSVTQTFPSSEILSGARNFILQKLDGAYDAITLSTAFPKRKFTENEMTRTLLDLDLAPSAILIVLPESSSSQSSSSGLFHFISILIGYVIMLWHIISNFLFGAAPQTQAPAAEQSTSNPRQQQQMASSDEDEQQIGARRRAPLAGSDSSTGLRKRQDGNVHRLTADDDDDDELATWNGNSTQQM